MAEKHKRPLNIRISERLHGGHSEGYLWLRLHYAQLKKRMAVRYPPYAEVAAEMAAEGVRGGQRGREKPMTEMAVRRMWPRVCRDVAEDARRRAAVLKLPPGWQPEPVAVLPAPEVAKPSAVRPAPAQATPAAPTPRAIPPIRPIPPQRPAEATSGAVRSPEEIATELEAVREQMRADRKYLPGAHKQPARRP